MLSAVTFKKVSFRFGSLIVNSFNGTSLCKSTSPAITRVSTITSKHFRDRSVKKPAPWPYKDKKYTGFHSIFFRDNTLKRFDENTQLIVVEGNIGVGKTELAKKIADELEMLHLPEPNVESLFVDERGFDLRQIDHLLPPSYKCVDMKAFYENPTPHNVLMIQANMFVLRLEQYMEALAHITNTGQGVVLERCIYSDYVFMEALYKMGFMSPGVKSLYKEMSINSVPQIELKPTLVLYFDADVDTLMERIKKRNIDYEVNSKVLTKEYLEAIDHFYKQDYLQYISEHSEMLFYDWSQFGDIDEVVHDIEKVKFEKYDKYDKKVKEWRNPDRDFWELIRLSYSNQRVEKLVNARIPRFDVPEMIATTEDQLRIKEIFSQLGNVKYAKGFNPELGDKGIFFKLRGQLNYWELQKYRGLFHLADD